MTNTSIEKVETAFQITPAMIEAGSQAIDEYLFKINWEAQPMGVYSRNNMAQQIFEAMIRAQEIR